MARKKHRRRSSGFSIAPSFGGLAIVGFGVLLGTLAVPKFVSAISATTGEAVVTRLKESKPVGDQGLDRARESLQAAARALPTDYRAPRDLALIELLAARRVDASTPDYAKRLDAAIKASHASLRNNPAQPYVWLRLAHAELASKGVSVEAALAFTMSLETGPQVIDLMQPRVVLGLVLWPVLNERQQERVLAQIRGLARYNPRILSETVLTRPGLPQVRAALKDEPELMEAFLKWYIKRRTPGIRLPTK